MSNINTKIRQRISSDKLSVQTKLPSNSEGRDGDLRLTTVKGVNILFGKINGKWYNFGHGKTIGHRNKAALKEKVTDDHIRQLNLDADLYMQKAKFSISDKEYLTINSGTFDIESSNTVSKLYIGDVSLQPGWGTTGATIKLENSEGHGKDLKLLGGGTTGVNKDGGDTILSSGLKTGSGDSGSITLGAGDSGTSAATALNVNATSTVLSGTLTINNIGTDTAGDNYLVEVSGVVKKRTPAEVLSDIGVTFGIADTNAVRIDGGDIASGEYARFTSNGLESRTLGEIKTDIGTGNSALVPAAGSSGHFLAHNGAFAQVAYSNLSGTPTIPANYVTDDADDTMEGTLTIDKNSTATSTAIIIGQTIDLDHTGITGAGQSIGSFGLMINADDSSVTHVGAHTVTGLQVNAISNTHGVGSTIGMLIDADGGDNNTGLKINTAGTHIKLEANADANDYATIAVANTGDLTITTVGTGTTDSDISLNADGDINLDAVGGQVTITDSNEGNSNPQLKILSTESGSYGSQLIFTQNSSSPANNDHLGLIYYQGKNDAGAWHMYGQKDFKVLSIADGAERAEYNISVAAGSTGNRKAFELEGQTDDTVDVTLGYGSTSTTEVIGELDIANIAEIASDTDKFLMSHSGVVKYVTGANLLSYIGGQATVTAGTNCTFSGATLNVDDAFLKNDADDTTTGTITAGGFTTTGTWTFDDATSGTVGITTVHTGSSFTDNDTSLMTAGAIKEKIESYGYSTTSGDITGVTAGDGLSGGGSSGGVSLAVNVDDSTIETNSDTLRVKDSGITLAKMADIADNRILGRYDEGDSGAPIALTAASVRALLNVADGATANTGDITGVTITTDSGSGSKATDTSGSADFSILGSNGVGVTNSGATITAVAVPGEIDHDSLNNFVANEHIDWTGASAGTIHSTNYSNTMGSGFTVSATTDSNATTITQGDDLMFAAGTGITCETTADGTVTISSTVTDTNTTYSAGALLDLSTTTFNVDLTELTDGTADVVGSEDELVYLDDGVQKRKQIDEIKLGQFNNDQGWTSNTGDITGVDLTGGTGISIDSETNTTSGSYSATITCNVEGTEIVSTGETGGTKFLREDGDGTCSWQTVSGGGGSNFITDNAADVMTVTDFGANAALKIDANQPSTTASEDSTGLWIDYDRTQALSGTGDHNDIGIDLDVNAGSLGTSTVKGMDIDVVGTTAGSSTATGIDVNVSGSDTKIGLDITAATHIKMTYSADSNDYGTISVGNTGDMTIASTGDEVGKADITLSPNGKLILDAVEDIYADSDIGILASKKLYFDATHSGGSSWAHGDTTIYNSDTDELTIEAGGIAVAEFKEIEISSVSSGYVHFPRGVGFTQHEPTYNASSTNVFFSVNGLKAFLTFGSGNITDLNLTFPNVSCNCTLVIKQDATGGRSITNWYTFDQSSTNQSTVKWAGASAPTLTSAANRIDIVSFYWDNDNHTAYGVISQNFN